jgi:hypothetical protein
MTSSTLRRCFVTSLALGLSVSNALSAQVPTAATTTTTSATMLAAATTAAFRSGLLATAMPDNSTHFLQAIALRWPVYSAENRYRVLRAVAKAGPWVVDHEVVGVVDTVRRLPSNTRVFLRVVALNQARPSAWLGVDTTNEASAVTPQHTPKWPLYSDSYSHAGVCSITPQGTFSVSWIRVPDASGYLISTWYTTISPYDLTMPPSISQPDTLVRDTVMVRQNNWWRGNEISLRAWVRYDLANWPGPGQTTTLAEDLFGRSGPAWGTDNKPKCINR